MRKQIRGVLPDDHILGDPKAAVIIVEFSDPECPYCKVFHQTLHHVMRENRSGSKTAWIYRHFPVEELHPKAFKEAEALECAAQLGGNAIFWRFVDRLYELTASNNALDIGVHNTPVRVPLAPDGTPYYSQRVPRRASDAGQLSDIAQGLGLGVAAFENCVASGRNTGRVQRDLDEAVAAGGDGTPYSVIIALGDQMPVQGNHSYVAIKRVIDTLLK